MAQYEEIGKNFSIPGFDAGFNVAGLDDLEDAIGAVSNQLQAMGSVVQHLSNILEGVAYESDGMLEIDASASSIVFRIDETKSALSIRGTKGLFKMPVLRYYSRPTTDDPWVLEDASEGFPGESDTATLLLTWDWARAAQ